MRSNARLRTTLRLDAREHPDLVGADAPRTRGAEEAEMGRWKTVVAFDACQKPPGSTRSNVKSRVRRKPTSAFAARASAGYSRAARATPEEVGAPRAEGAPTPQPYAASTKRYCPMKSTFSSGTPSLRRIAYASVR